MSLIYTISKDWIILRIVMHAFNSLAFTVHIYYSIGCHNYFLVLDLTRSINVNAKLSKSNLSPVVP